LFAGGWGEKGSLFFVFVFCLAFCRGERRERRERVSDDDDDDDDGRKKKQEKRNERAPTKKGLPFGA
jgi:hypothetical protein